MLIKNKYQLEIDYILEHKARNKLLIKLAMNQKKNTLMLFNYVDRHGKLLLADLQAQADQNLKRIYFIYQKVKGEEREVIRKTLDGAPPTWYDIEFDNGSMIRFQSSAQIQLKNGKTKVAYELTILDNIDMEWLEEHFKHGTNYRRGHEISKISKIVKQVGCNILLASYGTLAVGVNIKNLHTLIFCHPLKAKIRTLQSIGRILRTADGKGQVKLIDIVDDFSYTRGTKIQTNTTLKHFFERLKIYESESFKYDITEYKL
jgi:predicted helicase